MANGNVAPVSDTSALVNTFADSADLVYASSDYSAGGYPLLTCSFSGGSLSVSGSSLSCSASNGNNEFFTCPLESYNSGAPASSLIISNGYLPGSDCQSLGLLAMPACD
jgi:hypothetical protein